MKKWLPISLILLAIIIPQAAFAVWGSPLNWFNHWTFTNPHVQELETQINELQEKINDPSDVTTATEQRAAEVTPVHAQNGSVQVTSGNTKGPLLITNVKNDITTKSARITWTTTVPSRSQLIFTSTGQGLDSVNGIGTSHEIEFTAPSPGVIYNYQIVAHTPDGKSTDNYYGQYTAVGPNLAYFAHTGECGAIYIEDYTKKALAGFQVSMTVKYRSNNGVNTSDEYSFVTDGTGEIAGGYAGCGKVNTIYLSGKNLDVTLRNSPQ